MTTEKKYPKAIQALFDVLAAEQQRVAAAASAAGVASDVEDADVESAHVLAEIAYSLVPKAAKATADEKAHAKAIATANSVALAFGDHAAKRLPQPASILGYKLLSGLSKTATMAKVTELLGTIVQTSRGLGRDLAGELERSTVVVSKHGNLTKSGVKGATPAAKAWRALTGSACAAGIMTAAEALALGQAIAAEPVAKAA